MDSYLLIKMIHIISAVVVAGTGMGIAFFMFMASKTDDPKIVYNTAKTVVLADWIFTTPAVITQFITGILLMNILGYSYSSTWFITVISLFIFIGMCWLPVLKIQYRLKNLSYESIEKEKLNSDFHKMMRYWILLGIPAFISIVIIFWLMVFKPLEMF